MACECLVGYQLTDQGCVKLSNLSSDSTGAIILPNGNWMIYASSIHLQSILW